MKRFLLKTCLIFSPVFMIVLSLEAQYDPEVQWGKSITHYERLDSLSTPQPGGILFLGSSSFTIWEDVRDYFPGKNIVNRGFGGSQMSDILHFKERLILPYQPNQIVVYVGENDLDAGESPESVFEEGKQLVSWTREHFPNVQFLFLSVKPSPRRWDLRDKMKDLNLMLAEFALENKFVDYVNIWDPMIGENGRPRNEIYMKDSLHMNANGYKIWQKVMESHLK
jgi:lysophospholipase L1-like esterase